MDEMLIQVQAYLDYIKDHYNNVLKAWEIITSIDFSNTASRLDYDFGFLYLRKYDEISEMIKYHDMSKLSIEEFIPYRRMFYPTEEDLDINGNPIQEVENEFRKASLKHKMNNDHHWEIWTEMEDNYLQSVHNFVDWFAMAIARNQKPLDYYRDNKDIIKLPKKTIKMFNEIEKCLIEMESY